MSSIEDILEAYEGIDIVPKGDDPPVAETDWLARDLGGKLLQNTCWRNKIFTDAAQQQLAAQQNLDSLNRMGNQQQGLNRGFMGTFADSKPPIIKEESMQSVVERLYRYFKK